MTSVLVMSILLLLSIYVVSFTITEYKISNSHSIATKTYYLTESGIAEAIWRIKNDATWKSNFETDPNWSITFTRDPALYSNGSYQIQIDNSSLARGMITVTGYIQIGDSTAQRVVQTSVYKAIGETGLIDNGEVADGVVNLTGTVLNIHNGSMHANSNIIVDFWSIINADNEVRATGNININWNSSVVATAKRSSNYPPAPDYLPIPAVSFDDPSDPDSYLNQATLAGQVYDDDDFEDLMWANQNLTLNGVTYVMGDIEIKGDQNLTINGVLVADGDIEVGKNTIFCCWGARCGQSEVTIDQTSSTSPAGLLSKGRIDFELCLDSYQADGLTYATDKINVLGVPGDFDVWGALVSRKLTLTSIWQNIDIFFDNYAIAYTMGDPAYSPVVTVEHWEEEY
ncbi:MAG TPA: hypothetical protein VJB67_00415 [Patescibacteria group bacterium]|nr:hypothetical protein [Patescibacteria group bacterium]